MTPPYINGGMTAATIARDKATRKPPLKPTVKPQDKKPVPKPDPQAKYINDAVNRLGVPMTDAQIQTNASGQLSPIIAALTASIGRQASAGTQAISGYTSNLQQQLAPFKQSAADIYGGAEQSQAASDAALSAKLQGEGGQQAQDLGARLASINAPGATNAAVGQATADATGAGNALYGTGSASLANLIAAGAAEQSYAGKLPGIAGLSGLQQTGSLQAQLSGKLADQTGQLQAKVPDIVAGLQGQRSDLLGRRETLRENLNVDQSNAAAKKQALAQERKALGLPDSSLSGKFGYVVDKNGNPKLDKNGQPHLLPGYHVNAKGSVVKDVKPKTPKERTVNTTLSAANHYLTDSAGNAILKNGAKQPYKAPGTTKSGSAPSSSITHAINDGFLYDAAGNRVVKNGAPVKAPKTGTAGSPSKPLTVPQNQKATADAYGIARNGFAGKDGNGDPAPKLNVGQAWDQMKLHGLLADPRTKALSVKALIETYGRAGARFVRKQGIGTP